MDNFEDIYEKIVKKPKAILEKKRIKFLIMISFYFLIAMMMFWLMYNILKYSPNIYNSYEIFIIFVLLVGSGFIKLYKSSYKKYSIYYKNYVIDEFVKLIDTNFSYYPENGMGSGLYNKGDYAVYARDVISDDMIEGKIDDCYIMFSDVQAYRVKYNGSRETKELAFSGYVAYVEIKNKFEDSVTITNQNIFFRDIEKRNKIKLDSSEFEKNFDVYGNNSVLAYRFLTSDIMELILNFKKTLNVRFEIKILKNRMLIRFFTNEVFEAKVLKSSINKKALRRDYELLNFVLKLTKKMTKICNEIEL